MLKCPHKNCDFTSESVKGWKQHMSKSHSGWTPETYEKAVQDASASEGAGLAGAKDIASADAPPTDKPQQAETGSKYIPRKERLAEELRLEKIGRIRRTICKAAAEWPYSTLAWYLDMPEMKLTNDEAATITEGYTEVADALGWEFASRLWLLLIALEANRQALEARWPLIKKALEEKANPEEKEQEP